MNTEKDIKSTKTSCPCTPSCWIAKGNECNCECGGRYHGVYNEPSKKDILREAMEKYGVDQAEIEQSVSEMQKRAEKAKATRTRTLKRKLEYAKRKQKLADKQTYVSWKNYHKNKKDEDLITQAYVGKNCGCKNCYHCAACEVYEERKNSLDTQAKLGDGEVKTGVCQNTPLRSAKPEEIAGLVAEPVMPIENLEEKPTPLPKEITI